MQETIFPFNRQAEFYTEEGCYIIELSNSPEDEAVSIARARVKPEATTAWHQLRETTERYVILEGTGCVEIGTLPPKEVTVGDVILIPPSCPQRITNTGKTDLIFLAICNPRFRAEAYLTIGNDGRDCASPRAGLE